MYNARKVCLSVIPPSGAFCAAQSWTPTAAFETLGLRYVCLHLTLPSPHGQPDGRLSCWVTRSKTFLVKINTHVEHTTLAACDKHQNSLLLPER